MVNQMDKGICPICGKKTKYLSKDLRPVFPEERLLLEILLNKKINEFITSSVWAVNNRYYIDGKSISIPSKMFQMADIDVIRERLEKHKKYEEIDAVDSFIMHQNQKKDLKRQWEIGAKAYRAEQEEKIHILEWLLKNCNDGRKKTFYCLAVNLLELEEVKKVTEQAKADERFEVLPLKEKAAYLTAQFQKAAEKQGVLLKLRKKK